MAEKKAFRERRKLKLKMSCKGCKKDDDDGDAVNETPASQEGGADSVMADAGGGVESEEHEADRIRILRRRASKKTMATEKDEIL